MALQNVTVEEQFSTVADILESPVARCINLATNNYIYSGTEEDLIVNYILIYSKDKDKASREENPNWRETTT